MSFLTILTRVHPARPTCLKRNIWSVKVQTDQDVQHLLLSPIVETHSVIKAGPLIYHVRDKVNGKYVMILDDDDMLRTARFVERLKSITAQGADMVIFRSVLGRETLPPNNLWKRREIKRGYVAGPNAIVKYKIYKLASREWLRPVYCSDYYYLKAAHKLSGKTIWWNYIGVQSQGIEKNNEGKSEEFIQARA